MDKERQIYQQNKENNDKLVKAISEKKPFTLNINGNAVKSVEIKNPKGEDGAPGKDGVTPVKGVDYFTKQEQEDIVIRIIRAIPKPKDGKDAEPVDYLKIEDLIKKEVSKIPKPENGIDGVSPVIDYDSVIKEVTKNIPEIDYKTIYENIGKEVERIERSRPRQLQSAGPSMHLADINDVDVQGITPGQVLSWNGTNWVATTVSGGGAVDSVNGQTGVVVLTPADLGITATTTELNYVDGVTSPIQTQLDSVMVINERLTSQTFPNAIAGNIASGNVDLYTCPAGKRAIVNQVTLTNTTGVTVTSYMQMKVSGTYYRLATNSVISTGTDVSLQSFSLVLEAGESLAINTNNAGLNVFPQIIEFDNTVKTKTVKILSVTSGDNTIYTVPSGKTAFLLTAAPFRNGVGTIYYANTSGTTATFTFNIASGTSSSSSNRIRSSSTGAATVGSYSTGVMIPTGYSVLVNTNQTGGHAWVSVIEI